MTGGASPLPEDESTVAIAALAGAVLAQVYVDARMAQRTAAAVAGDDGGLDFDGLRRRWRIGGGSGHLAYPIGLVARTLIG